MLGERADVQAAVPPQPAHLLNAAEVYDHFRAHDSQPQHDDRRAAAAEHERVLAALGEHAHRLRDACGPYVLERAHGYGERRITFSAKLCRYSLRASSVLGRL